MLTIYETLLKTATKSGLTFQSPDESNSDYLLRLVKLIATIPENDWDSLPKKSQEWFNQVAERYKNKEVIDTCPGFKEIAVVEDVPNPKPKILKTNLKKLKKKKGAIHEIRETILLHPDWSNKLVYDHVVNLWPNTKPETVAVNGSDIRHLIDLMKKMGWTNSNENKVEVQKKKEA